MLSKTHDRLKIGLIIIGLALVMIMQPIQAAYAMSDDSSQAESNEEVQSEEGKGKDNGDNKQNTKNNAKEKKDSDAGTDTNNTQNNSDPEGIIEENAPVTRGNASLGDAAKTSGQMDFYTIRTANNQTYYLVVDHSGAVDNVYLLSTIDENDLEDFVDSGAARNGGLIALPDSKTADEDNSTVEGEDGIDADADKDNEAKPGKTAGVTSLALIAAAAVIGGVVFMRSRKKAKEEQEYADENLEYDDGIPTIREDDDD